METLAFHITNFTIFTYLLHFCDDMIVFFFLLLLDCPARLRFLGYFASEEKASLAFDVAYSQRNAHMGQGQGQGQGQITTSPPQYHVANSHTHTHSNADTDSDIKNSFQKIRNDMKEKESHLGEKVAVGAQAVSDALLQLRVHVAKEHLESLELHSGKEVERVAGGRLNFNTLSESLPLNSAHHDINKTYSNTEMSRKTDAEHTQDIALLTDIIRDKLPPPPHDCNDNGGPSLDLVLSVLSTDSLIKGIGAMGTPHTHSYKKDSPVYVKTNPDTDCKTEHTTEVNRTRTRIMCRSHCVS